jgi:hypothetical protein
MIRPRWIPQDSSRQSVQVAVAAQVPWSCIQLSYSPICPPYEQSAQMGKLTLKRPHAA